MKRASETMTFCVIFILAISVCALAWPVPDTGQTKCYDVQGNEITCPQPGEDFYGQDGNYTINPPSYTKLDAQGNDLSDDATEWVMVRDNVTGLIWEVKQAKDYVADYSNPHDADNKYTWYDSNPDTNGGDVGTPGDGTDTEDFINILNSEKFGGHSDWRLPRIKELASVKNLGLHNPAIDTKYFTNIISWLYCSSSSCASNPGNVWNIQFHYGYGSHSSKSYDYCVCAVRGGQDWPFGNWVINGDATVIDTGTGLTWQQQGPDSQMNWKEALAYCENLSLAGHDDWRLPTVRELASLLDLNRYSPASDTDTFPDMKSGCYWSSSSFADVPGDAWYVSFNHGGDYHSTKSSDCYVRAMRGGYGPFVSSLTPNSAILNEVTTFTIHGSNLTSGMGFWIDECSGVTELPGGTSTERYFQCTPSYSTGIKDGIVKDAPGGNALHEFTVDVGVSDGTIQVNSNLPEAAYTLTGPATYNGSGASWSKTGALVGEYVIAYDSVACWQAPAPETKTLTGGGIITFSGTYLDNTVPEAPPDLQATLSPETWSDNNTITASWTAGSDCASGVAGYSYVWNTSPSTAPDNTVETSQTSVSDHLLPDGNSHYFHVCTVDNSGNRSTALHIGPFFIDTVPPTTSADPVGDIYYTEQQTTLTCDDEAGSGCSATYYTTGGSEPTNSYSAPVPLSEGQTTLRFFSTDKAGNAEQIAAEYYTVIYDPSLEITVPEYGSIVENLDLIQGTASDTSGGVSKIELKITDGPSYLTLGNGGQLCFGDTEDWIPASLGNLTAGEYSWTLRTEGVNWAPGVTYIITVRAAYMAGDREVTGIVSFGKAPSAITCELSNDGITLGEPLRITGKIVPAPDKIGTGVNIALLSPDGREINKTAFANIKGEFSYHSACDDINHAGIWTVRTSWLGDSDSEAAESGYRTFEVSKAETLVTLDVTSQSVKSGDPIKIFGRFLPVPNCGKNLSDIGLQLTVSRPDGTTDPYAPPVYTKNELGQFEQEYDRFSGHLGEWTVHVGFAGDDAYLPSESEPVTVRVVETAGYAIIIQGKTRNGEGLKDHGKTTQFAYETLRQRDFHADDIRYFNYDRTQEGVCGIPTKDAISESITVWAKNKLNEHPANLYIVMVNHGGEDKFYIYDSDAVTPSDLDDWLNTLHNGLTDQARRRNTVLVLGFCYSGSFIPALSGGNRVIITSAAADEISFRGYMDERGVREGEYFVAEFFKSVSYGKSVRECFEEAASLAENYTSDLRITAGPPYFDKARQHPLMDDNGDGKGSNDLSVSDGDGTLSGNIFSVGTSTRTHNAPGDVCIARVADTVFLNDSETCAEGLWAEVENLDRLGTIWAEVKSPVPETETVGADPDFDPALTGQSAMRLPKIPTTDYDQENHRYEWKGDGNGIGGFSDPGIYQVFYFAKDYKTENVSQLTETRVYKNRAGNRSPGAFALISPADGEEVFTSAILDWEDTTDPDGDSLTYTLLIAEHGSFPDTEPAIRKEGLSPSACLLTPDDKVEAGRDYYWKVLAVDEYGAVRESGTRMFHTPIGNPDPSWIQGHVYNASTKEPVAAFDVVVGDETLETVSQGYYIGEKSPGKYDVMTEAAGYEPARAEVEITEGEVVSRDFGLEPKDIFKVAEPSFSPKPGAYTGTQDVTISCATPDTTIYQTTDGLPPTEYSEVYTSSIPISASTTIKARAYRENWIPSETIEAAYEITKKGDINGDDNIDLADAILILRIMTGTEITSTINIKAETDGDDEIGLAEVIYIMQKLTEFGR